MTLQRIYLNDSLNKYYVNCLIEEIESNNIDEGLAEHLLSISKSKNVKSIFSKKGVDSINKRDLHSFLRIAFTKEAEIKLFNQIKPFFESKYGNIKQILFDCYERKPSVSISRDITIHNKGAKWLVDSEYFNVSQLTFELKKGNKELHDEFWNELNRKLSLI